MSFCFIKNKNPLRFTASLRFFYFFTGLIFPSAPIPMIG